MASKEKKEEKERKAEKSSRSSSRSSRRLIKSPEEKAKRGRWVILVIFLMSLFVSYVVGLGGR